MSSPAAAPSWTDPGAFPVADGVHRIPLPLPNDGLRAVNVYVLAGEDGLTCIDGGWALAESRSQLEDSLREIGHHPRDIASFLVTHVHRDHYTQAIALREEFGRPVVSLGAAEKGAIDWVRAGNQDGQLDVRLRRAGALELARTWRERVAHAPLVPEAWGYPDHWLKGDVTVVAGHRTLEALATPGHTAGHYVFADQSAGLLFAGDHVLPTITPSVGFEATPTGHALTDFLASLAKVRALPDLTLLPAHGAVGMSSHARIDELLAHHEHRLALCREAVASGSETAYEVAQQLAWTRREHKLRDLDPFNAGLAIMETAVHLDLLEATHEVLRVDDQGVARYRLMA
jgi:glyoxylase-like metal-dependent hydrolase (beta-lactamase superfamily II)